MKYLLLLISLFWSNLSPANPVNMDELYKIKFKTIDGKETSLNEWKGKKILIVNTASECGYTPQYYGLEKIYKKYKEKNFVILGFPSNDFGGQEPGTNSEIKTFCERKVKVTFPMFEKISVKGADAHPLYKFLQNVTSKSVQWNFGKYLIKGTSIQFFPTRIEPEDESLTKEIESN